MIGFFPFLVPLGPREFDTAERYSEVFQAIVDNLRILLYVLNAEITSEASENAARILRVEVYMRSFMMACPIPTPT